jgi:hypothetical protein
MIRAVRRAFVRDRLNRGPRDIGPRPRLSEQLPPGSNFNRAKDAFMPVVHNGALDPRGFMPTHDFHA